MPGGHVNFKPKRVGETCYLSAPFDFTSAVANSETVSSAVCTASVYSGTDASPSSVIFSTSTVQNSYQVLQKVTGGVSGVIYKILCTATTSLGSILEQAGYLAVIPDLV